VAWFRLDPKGEIVGRRYYGQSVPRREDRRFITGKGQYLDNLPAPGALHLVLVRCPYAHARILDVDPEQARAIPDVVAVFSGADLRPDWNASLPMMWAVTDEVRIPDHWPIAVDEARFAGDAVAVVVGRTLAAAKDGAEAVQIEYDPLPAVTDMEAALGEDAPLVHPGFGTNVCYRFGMSNGDVDAVFSSAEVTISRRLKVPRLLPSPMETRAVLAEPGRRGGFTLTTTSQVPHMVRRFLSETVGLSEHELRVVAPDVGGAFGAKLNVYAEEALALALARRFDAPVKWVEERSESSAATAHGRGQIQDFSLAARRDGRVLGIRVSILSSMGAYLQLETAGLPVLGRLMFPGQYGFEAYSFDATSVFTNEPPTGAYRGVGRAEATYGLERMMDHLAREVGVDPAEIRRRNYLPRGESVINGAGIPYDSVDYQPPLDRALQLAGYAELRKTRSDERGGRRRGIGICSYVDATGLGSSPLLSRTNYQWGGWESGRVRVLPTGKVEVFSGTVPQGQGHETAWAQLAADSLGVPMEDVAVLQGDTAIVPHGTGTFGSRSLCVGGTAIHLAAQAVIAKARTIAAHLLETAPEDLEFGEGRFSVAGAPARQVSLPDVAKAAYLAHSLPAGTDPGLDENAVFEPPDWTYPFGVHVAVVEVDTETGEVRIVSYVAVDDCGNVLNPLLVEGQVRGGIAQGVGQALFEEVTYSPDGQPEATSLLSYLVPSAADVPTFELDRTTTPTTVNPLGAKGVAEAGAIAAPAAIMNAVVDALAPLGVDDVDMPASPERVWAAIRAAKERG
jgi:aerobic carbon-monoxide dehydrogenase large subunit